MQRVEAGRNRKCQQVRKGNESMIELCVFSNLLRNFASLNHEDEYSLHHKFSDKQRETDQAYVEQVVTYISDRGNPFKAENTTIKNLATGATPEAESTSFLLGNSDVDTGSG